MDGPVWRAEPRPSEPVVADAIGRWRGLDDLKTEEVAVERQRRRHIEDLQQGTHASKLERHRIGPPE
jgi:hypothetical protein